MPDLSAYRKLLIFGGTFDPPHIGHVTQPERVRRRLGFEVVVYLPTGRSPHKQGNTQTDDRLRLQMIRAATNDQPHAVVCDLEMRRPPPSYTVDTLKIIARQLKPQARMRLLIGADQARVFDQWFKADRIAELAEPVVMVRPPDTIESLRQTLPDAWHDRLIQIPAMDLSATQIRARVAVNQSIDEFVAPAVAKIIQAHDLYNPKNPSP